MFYFDTINNKKIMKSDLLDKQGFMHFFTTRETAIKSSEPDMTPVVKANKKDICRYLGITAENLISPSQTHTNNVELTEIAKNIYPDTDALILTNNTQAVFLNFADCTPVILYDEAENIAAIAHAGWRGTAGEIVKKTVKKMFSDYGCQAENITAAIGPAISDCCYPVGKEVYEQLKKTVKDNDEGCFFFKEDKIYTNLKKINYRQLLACGIKKIDLCNYCTSCTNELFFSYRKENGTTSRHSAVIKLN